MSATTIEQVPSGAYNLDPVHSTFGFAVKHNGVSTFRGQFEQVDVKLENGVLTGTAQVDSVKTAIPDEGPSPLAGLFQRRGDSDGHLPLDRHPHRRRRQRGGRRRPDDPWRHEAGDGQGTIAAGHRLSGAEVVGLDLEAAIDRREYGLNWQAELPNGGDALAWDVVLEVHVELPKAS